MKKIACLLIIISLVIQGGNNVDARTKKLTDATYSPTVPASEEAIRTQIDGSIQEVYDIVDEAKTDINGDHLGTWRGLTPTQAEPGLSATVEAHLADNAAHGLGTHIVKIASETELGHVKVPTANIDGNGLLIFPENTSISMSAAYGVLQKLYHDEEDVDIVVLGDSTGNETTEWVYLFAQQMASSYPAYTVKYYLWDSVNFVYGAATTIQTGSGANTLHVWNASVAGISLPYPIMHGFANQVVAPNPDLVFISFGHNEGNIINNEAYVTTLARYHLLPQYILNTLPQTAIMMIAQNPQTANDYQKTRAQMIREVVNKCGYGYINVHDAFLAVADWSTTLMADTTHPNAAGQQVWLDEVMKYFDYSLNMQPLTQIPSSLTIPTTNLLANGDFSAFASAVPDNWTNGVATIVKDNTNFETGTYGVKMTTGAGASGSIYQTVNLANSKTPLNFFKGKWITLAVRLRKPTGQPATAGRISLYDGVNTATSRAAFTGDGSFYWEAVSLKVDNNATAIRAYIYADSGTTGNVEVTVDRAILCFGLLPKDII